VNVLDRQLKTVESSGLSINRENGATVGRPHLWNLDFFNEPGGQVLDDYPIGSREEGENVFYEVFFVSCELLPVVDVSTEVNLLG